MKEKARITWERRGGGNFHIQVKGSGGEILMGIKDIVTGVAEVLAKESGMSRTVMKGVILEFIKEGGKINEKD